MLRSCYLTRMRLAPGVELDVRWYFAPSGAKVFPGVHAFGSLNYEDPPAVDRPEQIGEVADLPHQWTQGFEGRFTGQCHAGTDSQWRGAIPVGTPQLPLRLNGVPTACAPAVAGGPGGAAGMRVGLAGSGPFIRGKTVVVPVDDDTVSVLGTAYRKTIFVQMGVADCTCLAHYIMVFRYDPSGPLGAFWYCFDFAPQCARAPGAGYYMLILGTPGARVMSIGQIALTNCFRVITSSRAVAAGSNEVLCTYPFAGLDTPDCCVTTSATSAVVSHQPVPGA